MALGAEVIEKHFTLNNKMKGPDHKSSLNPRDFEPYGKKNRRIQRLLLEME